MHLYTLVSPTLNAALEIGFLISYVIFIITTNVEESHCNSTVTIYSLYF